MFAETLLNRCRESGDDPFVLFEDEVISYARLLDGVQRTATLLNEHGVRSGDRVLLTARNTPTFLYLWFALRWVGAVCVPLHSQAAPDHIRGIIADADIRFVIGDSETVAKLSESGAWNGPSLGFASIADLEQRVTQRAPRDPVLARPSSECSLLYTSGTTGAPKGVVLADASFVAGGKQMGEALGITKDDRILLALPLYHTNPQVYGVMTALTTGCSLALVERFRPLEFIDQAIRFEATGFTYVGTVLSALRRALPESVPPHKLRFCTGGGAPIEVWTEIEDRLGVAVHELYGMTELGGWITANHAGDIVRGTCGTPRPDMELAVLDVDDEPAPAGQSGEICARPRQPHIMFSGYHNRVETTLAKMSNLWFHTGDRGVLDKDGRLSFLGRMDDLIRHNGENVNPADVESVLAHHPDIDEVAVVGIPDEIAGQEIRAVIVGSESFDPYSVPAFLDGKLPKLAWPRYVAVTEVLPKTATQKVQAASLRRRDGADVDLRAPRM